MRKLLAITGFSPNSDLAHNRQLVEMARRTGAAWNAASQLKGGHRPKKAEEASEAEADSLTEALRKTIRHAGALRHVGQPAFRGHIWRRTPREAGCVAPFAHFAESLNPAQSWLAGAPGAALFSLSCESPFTKLQKDKSPYSSIT